MTKKIIGKISIDLIKGEFTPKFYLVDEGEGMTEKQYTKGDYTNCRCNICEIVDEDDEVVCMVVTEDFEKVIGILEENEQLKTKNNAYLQDIEMFKEENTTLKLENQELHKLNQEYIDSLSDEKKETLSEMLNAILGDDGE